MEDRHHLTFETYEDGKLTLEEYLDLVVFHRKRPFTRAQFRRFMFSQSKPFPEMIALVTRLKVRHGLKIVVVSNEARELNAHRIRQFKLGALVDFFVSSSFVHIRKPDADIFGSRWTSLRCRRARVVYIENTPMFVQIAEGLGIRSILHTDYRVHAREARLARAPGRRDRTDERRMKEDFDHDDEPLSRRSCSTRWTPTGAPPTICRSARSISTTIRC